MATPDDRPDPIYGYVDDKISELKNDLLFNEIADLQEKLDNITKQLLDVKREAALVAIRGMHNSVINWLQLQISMNDEIAEDGLACIQYIARRSERHWPQYNLVKTPIANT